MYKIKDDYTALIVAVSKGHSKCVDILTRAGAVANILGTQL